MRWKLEGGDGQESLFAADVEHHVGRGEYRGMEFLQVRAQRIINTLPKSGRLPFRHTINAYRGCTHACAYCAGGDTPVLLANGRTKRLADLRIGDEIVGTEVVGRYRRYVATTVLDRWSVTKPAWRVRLDDGTDLITSGDHRLLSNRGWKHVTGTEQGHLCRPHLTRNNRLLGPGRFETEPKGGAEYRHGYLCGMIRGDANVACSTRGTRQRVHRFRLALVDPEPLERTRTYLDDLGVPTTSFLFQAATPTRKELMAIRAQATAHVHTILDLVRWPDHPDEEWSKGFLAGIFDAEGGCNPSLRIANTDQEIIDRITEALHRLGFRYVVEQQRGRPLFSVRLLGGLPEQLRFFLLTDPATTRKRSILGRAVKNSPSRRVTSIEPLGIDMPLYDITTGTGDYIADGVISHNCFARPTHDYLGLDIGEGFDRQIVVKVNAVERLRAELDPRRWCGEPIAMGTNTDPYQKAEGKYHLTRGLMEALAEAGNPFSLLTKSTLVLRDLDLLVEASARTEVSVNFSIGTLDEEVWRATEPGTPPPRKRVEALAKLREAGVRCGVLVAPVLPGLSDTAGSIDDVVSAVTAAGTSTVSGGMLVYLKPGVREVFLGRLATTHPELIPRYEALYPRTYAPKAEQQRVSALLDESIARHRGVRVAVRANRATGHLSAPEPSPPPPPASTQLGLGL